MKLRNRAHVNKILMDKNFVDLSSSALDYPLHCRRTQGVTPTKFRTQIFRNRNCFAFVFGTVSFSTFIKFRWASIPAGALFTLVSETFVNIWLVGFPGCIELDSNSLYWFFRSSGFSSVFMRIPFPCDVHRKLSLKGRAVKPISLNRTPTWRSFFVASSEKLQIGLSEDFWNIKRFYVPYVARCTGCGFSRSFAHYRSANSEDNLMSSSKVHQARNSHTHPDTAQTFFLDRAIGYRRLRFARSRSFRGFWIPTERRVFRWQKQQLFVQHLFE